VLCSQSSLVENKVSVFLFYHSNTKKNVLLEMANGGFVVYRSGYLCRSKKCQIVLNVLCGKKKNPKKKMFDSK
jgi:hypothetical protein